MKSRLFKTTFLFLILLLQQSVSLNQAGAKEWTEKKLSKFIMKADRAAGRKNWNKAIKYGEQAFQGCTTLNLPSSANHINCLKNLNRHYDKAGRLTESGPRIIRAYHLSSEHLGSQHNTTMISRMLYYKLLIATQKYQDAAILVIESLSLLDESEESDYKRQHYLKQLYSLYGLTNQLKKQAAALLSYHYINQKLGSTDGGNLEKSILILARNLCRQKNRSEYKKLVAQHRLKLLCK